MAKVNLKEKAKVLAKEIAKANAKEKVIRKRYDVLETKQYKALKVIEKLADKQEDVAYKLQNKVDDIHEKIKESNKEQDAYYIGKVYKHEGGNDLILVDSVEYVNGELKIVEGNLISNRLTVKEDHEGERCNRKIHLKHAVLVYTNEQLVKEIKIRVSACFEQLKKVNIEERLLSKKTKENYSSAPFEKKYKKIINAISRYSYPFDSREEPGIFEVIEDWKKENNIRAWYY